MQLKTKKNAKPLNLIGMCMGKISFKSKMYFSIISFVIPTVVLLLIMFRTLTKEVDFARQEIRGIHFQHSVEKIYRGIVFRNIFSQRHYNGDPEALARISNLNEEITQGFGELKKMNAEYGLSLELTLQGLSKRGRDSAEISKLMGLWDKIKGEGNSQSREESAKLHLELLTQLKTLITHVGDTSNLVLDTDLDSYYLADAVIGGLPSAQERLSGVAQQMAGMFASQNLDRSKLMVFISNIKDSDLSRIKNDTQTAINEDANFYGVSPSLHKNLPGIAQEFENSIVKLTDELERFVGSESATLVPRVFYNHTEDAIEGSFKLWEVAASELKILLEKRITTLSNERALSVSLITLALLLSCAFSIYIAGSTNKTMSSIMKNLGQAEERVQILSEQLNQASSHLSSASTEAAASLEETVASLEQISSVITFNSQNAVEASKLAATTRDIAVHGETEIFGFIKSMSKISNSSKKIEEIIQVIDDIAFQTNLLALNAAVEAARAGEQGKGFAVVAEAVRNLAQRSASSAKDISLLIKESVDEIHFGSKIADKSGMALTEIVKSIKKVSDLNAEIASANSEQVKGIQQINKAMNQLDQTGQSNAASAEQIAAASELLLGESTSLHTHVDELQKVVIGQAHRSAKQLSA